MARSKNKQTSEDSGCGAEILGCLAELGCWFLPIILVVLALAFGVLSSG